MSLVSHGAAHARPEWGRTLHAGRAEDEGRGERVAASELVPGWQGYTRVQDGGSRLVYHLNRNDTTVRYDESGVLRGLRPGGRTKILQKRDEHGRQKEESKRVNHRADEMSMISSRLYWSPDNGPLSSIIACPHLQVAPKARRGSVSEPVRRSYDIVDIYMFGETLK